MCATQELSAPVGLETGTSSYSSTLLIPESLLLFASWDGEERNSLVLCTQAEKGFLQSGWCTYIFEVNKGNWTKVKLGMPRNQPLHINKESWYFPF